MDQEQNNNQQNQVAPPGNVNGQNQVHQRAPIADRGDVAHNMKEARDHAATILRPVQVQQNGNDMNAIQFNKLADLLLEQARAGYAMGELGDMLAPLLPELEPLWSMISLQKRQSEAIYAALQAAAAVNNNFLLMLFAYLAKTRIKVRTGVIGDNSLLEMDDKIFKQSHKEVETMVGVSPLKLVSSQPQGSGGHKPGYGNKRPHYNNYYTPPPPPYGLGFQAPPPQPMVRAAPPQQPWRNPQQGRRFNGNGN
jgi:hypothetical protein